MRGAATWLPTLLAFALIACGGESHRADAVPNGGNAGGGGRPLVACSKGAPLVAEGRLKDSTGTDVQTLGPLAVTVSNVEPLAGASSTTALDIGLTGIDGGEWHYRLDVSDIPTDLVGVSEELELAVFQSGLGGFFTNHEVALARGTSLVAFSVATWVEPAPDLFGLYVTTLELVDSECVRADGSLDDNRALEVRHFGESANLRVGEEKDVGGLTVVVSRIIEGCTSCDPPNSYRFAGFATEH